MPTGAAVVTGAAVLTGAAASTTGAAAITAAAPFSAAAAGDAAVWASTAALACASTAAFPEIDARASPGAPNDSSNIAATIAPAATRRIAAPRFVKVCEYPHGIATFR